MKNQDSIEDFISRLKTRYSRDNPILDLLHLIELLRQEAPSANIPAPEPPKQQNPANI